ncbi:fasciclin domain-containing protein [Hufsiella ginkgonis]|uniref:FAS1 domain-containing protein n=1 Tax=Hufsiella ginkgonis TaxID=2695274 RepID=A0A7K1Y3I2_9SPHI|nr:fasciclin domain-containing protein [Hufsiella ginkgonis]MXV17668.1 hypothetical protein [Hufsiella ginkgonis]
MASEPTLSTFVSAIDKVPGLKDELNSSGLFTVMAPSNDAFTKYFTAHAKYKKIDDIPVKELTQMVKYHILKWMLFQGNFIKPSSDPTINVDIYKYETRAVASYYDAAAKKGVYYPSKMIQVYTPRFFSYYGVTSQDYTDVYGTGSAVNAQTQMNVMSSSVVQKDIASGNGVIHVIDRVLELVNNIAQELENNAEYEDYNRIMKRRFLSYTYNQAGTRAQGNNGDVNGDGLVDSLFNRTYTTDANLDNENPLSGTKSLSLTGFIPSKTAFKNYYETRLMPNFYGIEDSIPTHTLQLLYKGHLASTMDWPSKIDKGQSVSELGDKITLARSDIKGIKMTSNGILYTLNKVIEPKSFTTVPGPSFFSPQYWYLAEALIRTNLLGLLSSGDAKFTLLAPTNAAFAARGIYWIEKPIAGAPGFFRKPNGLETPVAISELTTLLGNHIIMNTSLSISDMNSPVEKFYPTQNGTFISIVNGKISGTERDSLVSVVNPNVSQSNGFFQGINKIIYYPGTLYEQINGATSDPNAALQTNPQYRKFKELMVASGINVADFANTASTTLPLAPITASTQNRKFTLFVPSNEAITAAQNAGKLPKTGAVTPNTTLTDAIRLQLYNYVSSFFATDTQIFTDGKTTGTFPSRKVLTATPLTYYPLTVSYNGTTLQVTSRAGEVATVDKTQPALYPQNKFAKDGVIHVINNAFTSQF